MTVGKVLRGRRGQLGWSLVEVSEATRIPVEHLEAIEDERWDDLPDGPYQRAYVKAYANHIGVKLVAKGSGSREVEEDAEGLPTTIEERRVGRLLFATGAMGALVVAAVWWWQTPAAEVVTVEQPDQQVRIVARRNTPVKVIVDNDVVFDRKLAGGQELKVAGHDRVVVELPAAENARVEYNGEALVPQGRQDQPRRLVFVDDTEPAQVVGVLREDP